MIYIETVYTGYELEKKEKKLTGIEEYVYENTENKLIALSRIADTICPMGEMGKIMKSKARERGYKITSITVKITEPIINGIKQQEIHMTKNGATVKKIKKIKVDNNYIKALTYKTEKGMNFEKNQFKTFSYRIKLLQKIIRGKGAENIETEIKNYLKNYEVISDWSSTRNQQCELFTN